jgi:Host cell surface-exposed lipoprotein/Protein of unknown function (DUF2510)
MTGQFPDSNLLIACALTDSLRRVTTPSPAPGWYPDPSGTPQQRYFDGQQWAEKYAPLDAQPPSTGKPEKPGMSKGKKIALGVGAAAVALIALGSVGNGNKTSSTPASSSSATLAMPSPTVSSPTTTKSGFTPAQDNALEKAKAYLSHSAFSKQGLIKQLEYEQFSTADATFAVENIEANGGVNWNEQAVKKAKAYLSQSSFSLPSLVGQLQYEGFTPDQAQYGANTAYGS